MITQSEFEALKAKGYRVTDSKATQGRFVWANENLGTKSATDFSCPSDAWDDVKQPTFPVPTNQPTMTTPHKHAATIKAWADGAAIEYRYHGEWLFLARPRWELDVDFRVRPEGKYTVAAYKPFTGSDGWTENKRTFQLDPTANQYNLVQTDGGGNALFLFETLADAEAACQAVNKSLTFA